MSQYIKHPDGTWEPVEQFEKRKAIELKLKFRVLQDCFFALTNDLPIPPYVNYEDATPEMQEEFKKLVFDAK